MMTPKAKTSLQNIGAFVAAVLAVTTITAPLSRAMAKETVIAHGDSVFVRRDSFGMYLQEERAQRHYDSLVHSIEDAKWAGVVADVDTLKRCVRHPRLGFCQ